VAEFWIPDMASRYDAAIPNAKQNPRTAEIPNYGRNISNKYVGDIQGLAISAIWRYGRATDLREIQINSKNF